MEWNGMTVSELIFSMYDKLAGPGRLGMSELIFSVYDKLTDPGRLGNG